MTSSSQYLTHLNPSSNQSHEERRGTYSHVWRFLLFTLVICLIGCRSEVQKEIDHTRNRLTPDPSQKKQPHLVIEGGKVHKFGAVQVGTEISHTFTFKNDGDAPLELYVDTPTCKCTVGDLSLETVPPGETSELTVKWHSLEEKQDFLQFVPILSNDVTNQSFDIRIEGSFFNLFKMIPDELSLTNVSIDEGGSGHFFMYTDQLDHFKILDIEFGNDSTKDFFSYTIEKEETPTFPGAKQSYKVNLEVKPGLALGYFSQQLKIEVDHEDVPRLEYEVTGTTAGAFTIYGPVGWHKEKGKLNLGTIPQQSGKKITLTLYMKNDSSDFSVSEVTTVPKEALQVSFGDKKKARGGTYVIMPIKIEVPPNTRSMSLLGDAEGEHGEILIKTDHPKVPEIRIIVSFAVAPG